MKKNRHLYVNGIELELDDEETIPITKQVNNIAELKDRQADFTTNFKIPATRGNRFALENANLLSSETYLPYAKNSCTYVDEGVELISDGFLVLFSYADGYYTAAAYSGTADFFKLIDGEKIASLSMPDLDITLDYGVFASTISDSKWLGFEPSEDGLGLTSEKLTLLNFRPFISLKRIFSEIVESIGWSITGDIDKIQGYLMCPNLSPRLSDYISDQIATGPSEGTISFRKNSTTLLSNPKGLIVLDTVNLRYINALPKKGKYRYTVSGKYLLRAAGTVSVWSAFMNRNGQAWNWDGNQTLIASNTTVGVVQDFSIVWEYTTTEANTSKGLQISANSGGADCTFYELKVSLQIVEADTQIGDTVSPATILPDMTQSNFLKSVANMYGLIFSVDGQRRTVNVWQFDRLLDNLGIARDWTKYLDSGSEVLSYRIGDYAQQNTMKYKTVEDVPEGYGDGSLYVNDGTLESVKDIFTLDFYAANDILFKNNVMARIPVCAKNDAGTYDNKDVPEARVVLAHASVNAPFTLKDTVGTSTVSIYDRAFFADISLGESLSFAYTLIPQHYEALSKALSKAKKLEVKMSIPVTEIQALDHSVPVYLDQYQAYFYINKVNGWVKGKLANVELIRIA